MNEPGRGAPSSGPSPRSRDGWMGAADAMGRWDGSMDGEPGTGDVDERPSRATVDRVRSRSSGSQTSRDLECLAREPAVALLVVGGRVKLITKGKGGKREQQGTCFVENSEVRLLSDVQTALLAVLSAFEGLPAQNMARVARKFGIFNASAANGRSRGRARAGASADANSFFGFACSGLGSRWR